MARGNATNFTGPLQFTLATAGTDAFKKEDVQVLAQAVDLHDHSTGKGLVLSPTAIPNGAITSAMIADGTITSADIADGTIATVDLANAAVTNAKLGPDVARANLLTNGGFEIWQRGNGPFTASGAYTADRWSTGIAGTDAINVQKQTTGVDIGSIAAASVTFSLGSGAGGTNLTQILRCAADGNQLAGRTLSLSVRVTTTTPNAVRINISDGVSNNYSSYHSGSGGWLTLTTTAVIPASTTVVYIQILFAASCTAYIDNACLVVGSQPADYVPLHPADDLARCLRYYEVVGGSSTQGIAAGWAYTTSGFIFPLRWRAQKAVAPTCTQVGTLTVQWGAGSTANGTLSMSGYLDGSTGQLNSVVGSPLTVGQPGQVYCGAASSYIAVEANP